MLEDDAPLACSLAPSAALAAGDELVHADLLRAGDPLGFTHPLVRAAVYGQLAFGERAQTHRRAARLLAEMGAAGERVSAHLLESPAAGDEVVVEALRAAARRALAQGVPGSAVSYRGKEAVGTVTARPAGGHLASSGAVHLTSASGVGHHGKWVAVKLAMRLPKSLAGETLRLDVAAVDRHGRTQLERHAGSIRVAG